MLYDNVTNLESPCYEYTGSIMELTCHVLTSLTFSLLADAKNASFDLLPSLLITRNARQRYDLLIINISDRSAKR